ncbi:MAG TPA: DUF2794 domain-containing protein [Devosia sp.]|uniref:DUF2794 domain-containing protein n=1 Tax=Devosia sp. TaxID=1871048 RepID=UPI002F95245C
MPSTVQGRTPNDKTVHLSLVQGGGAPAAASPGKMPVVVTFDRKELSLILNVYGRKVGQGEWRDYAMDFLRERAVFSIYARVSERPLFLIEKTPRLRNRQGQYAVTNQQGRILKRGHDLAVVLRVLDPQLAVIG